MTMLTLLSGVVVGLSLGLTGGGGSVFAVPLLVYGLSVAPREAVLTSLIAVTLTAAIGVVPRWRAGAVEIRTGLLFAGAGACGAPLGAGLSEFISDEWLLGLLAVVMLVMAARMAWNAGRSQSIYSDHAAGPSCRRDPVGRLQWTSRCALLLTLVGIGTGVLSGLFGVGGGFVIVPALVVFSGLDVHRAMATSLLVMTLVGAAAIASQLAAGRAVDVTLAAPFAAGGVVGMFSGQSLARRLSTATLQRVFAGAIVLTAVWMLARGWLLT